MKNDHRLGYDKQVQKDLIIFDSFFKCHYNLIRVLTWLCARFLYTTESLPHHFRDFSVGVGAFVIGLSQISSFFS